MARWKPSTPALSGPRTPTTWGRSKAWVAFTSRPLSIPTPSSPSPLYDRKNALVAADLLHDRVLPFLEEKEVPLLRVLTDRGTEYCGAREHHEYELYLAVEDVDHSRTKARPPQT